MNETQELELDWFLQRFNERCDRVDALLEENLRLMLALPDRICEKLGMKNDSSTRTHVSTYLTRLTPPGTAALAVLALHGPDAWSIVSGLFQPSLPDRLQPGTFRLGRLGNELGRDEVVLAVKAGPSVPVIEIHCHGGQQVLSWLQEILTGRGAVACSWPEFQRHLGVPAWQVEAQEALCLAATVRTAGILLDQYHGAFHDAVDRIANHIQAHEIDEACRLLDVLKKRTPLGRHLTQPWRLVSGGAVNVGKSSLINALAGHARSVVSPLPGTTRDVVTTHLALDGWPVEAADTAGWRAASDALESAGIALAQSALEQADLALWVLDGAASPVFPEKPLANIVYVINKTDLPAAWDWQSVIGARQVSAKTGEGVAELCQHLGHLLVPDPPAAKEPVPFNERLCDLVESLRDKLVC